MATMKINVIAMAAIWRYLVTISTMEIPACHGNNGDTSRLLVTHINIYIEYNQPEERSMIIFCICQAKNFVTIFFISVPGQKSKCFS